MKYAAACAGAFVIAKNLSHPWHKAVPAVVDQIVARHALCGGAWIVRGQVGKRTGTGERRRLRPPANDAELFIPSAN